MLNHKSAKWSAWCGRGMVGSFKRPSGVQDAIFPTRGALDALAIPAFILFSNMDKCKNDSD